MEQTTEAPFTDEQRAVFKRARLSRDARFDGTFFTGVSTTGIFCRPICPAGMAAKEKNVSYYKSAGQAMDAGLRPCLRCCPEAAPGSADWRGAEVLVERALRLIHSGRLGESVEELAEQVGVTGRHLRRLFQQHLGASPNSIISTHRTLFAKRLLLETDMSITEIALASGFGSIRRFNEVFRNLFGMPPRDMRRNRKGEVSGCLRLCYRPPFDWADLFAFFARRAMAGVEAIQDNTYARTFRTSSGDAGIIHVRPSADVKDCALSLEVTFASEPAASSLMEVVASVRRMCDLDADPALINEHLSKDPLLKESVAAKPGMRLPVGYDLFETLIRAIVGQQISVAGATTIMGRIADRFGEKLDIGKEGDPWVVFPGPADLAGADMTGLGLTNARMRTIDGVAAAIASGEISLDAPPDEVLKQLLALRGIGPWTARYVGMRGFGMPDSFPGGDLGLKKALGCEEAEANRISRRWSPWRAYAAMHLWDSSKQGG